MNIDGQPPAGERPVDLYCREIYWTEAATVPVRIGVEYTCDTELWDRWVDDLPRDSESDLIELHHIPLDWGLNLAPQFLRIMQRKKK